MPRRISFLAAAMISIALLGGCGPTNLAEGGIGGTGISTGTVTAIGSIQVNGVTFATEGAAIYVERQRLDDPARNDDADGTFLRGAGFHEGQVVRVVGEFHTDGRTGTASAVYFNDSIEGPIESITTIDAGSIELVVMDQTVIVDDRTRLLPSGTSLADLAVGDRVEVSGLMDDLGRIQAGYLQDKGAFNSGNEVEVKGVIDAASVTATTFTINSLSIDYTNADLSDLGTAVPVAGTLVEVKGSYDGSVLTASRVEREDDVDGADNDEVELEGIVRDAATFPSNGRFVLGQQAVQTNAATEYRGGLPGDLREGVRLEVEGHLQAGILIAAEIHFRGGAEVDAPVARHTPTPDGNGIHLTFDGLGTLTVEVNGLSKLSGAGDLAELESLLGNTTTPDYVEVRGRVLADGTVLAEELKIEDGSSKVEIGLQGPVENLMVTEPRLTLLGRDINTSTVTEFEGVNDTPISRDSFFASVQIGDLVKAAGTYDGSTVTWDKLELEDTE